MTAVNWKRAMAKDIGKVKKKRQISANGNWPEDDVIT